MPSGEKEGTLIAEIPEIREIARMANSSSKVSLPYSNDRVYVEEQSQGDDGQLQRGNSRESKITSSMNANTAENNFTASDFSNSIRESFTKAMKRFSTFVVVMMVCCLCSLIPQSVHLKNTIDFYMNDFYMDFMAEKLSETSRLSLLAREIFILKYQVNETDAGLLRQSALVLEELDGSLRDQISIHDLGYIKELLTEKLYFSWELSSDTIAKVNRNMQDLTDKLITSAIALSVNELFSSENNNFFYLYRNGLFETSWGMNRTIAEAGKIEKERIKQFNFHFLLLGGIYGCMIIMSFIVILIASIKLVEKRHRMVWSLLFNLPASIAQEIKETSLQRLEGIHNEQVK